VNRRTALAAGTLAATASVAGWRPRLTRAATDSPARGRPFALRYAPHFGMFAKLGGKDLVDQLKFAADRGFTAWEDNEMKDRPVAVQERIAQAMGELKMEMGVISALRGVWNAVNFAGNDAAAHELVLKTLRGSLDAAQRVRAKRLTVVLGMADRSLPQEIQTANAIDLLRRCCDVVDGHDVVMVLEPLNTKTNHPGIFLSSVSQAYAICRAIDRPSCKILFDIYHEQVSCGNLIATIDRCWSEVAYFQTADNPGRCEPGTGEINYKTVLKHLHDKGYRGIIGLEHGNSRPGAAGEQAVIDAYRAADPGDQGTTSAPVG
jgi:hydroxypyruvate isomerase